MKDNTTPPPYKMWQSTRGIPLVYTGDPSPYRPILTIENYPKWYTLFAITTESEVKEVTFDEISFGDEPTFTDHCFNPAAVDALVREKNYEIDETSFELIVGRWMIEIKGMFR